MKNAQPYYPPNMSKYFIIKEHPDKNTVVPTKNIIFLTVLTIVIYQFFLVPS